MRANSVNITKRTPEERFLYENLILVFRDYLQARHLCNGNSIKKTLEEGLKNFQRKYSRKQQTKNVSPFYKDRRKLRILVNGVSAEQFIFDQSLVIGKNIDFDFLCDLFGYNPDEARNSLKNMTHEEIKNLLKESYFRRE